MPISREVSTVDVTQQNAEDLKLRTGHEANPQQSKSDDWLSEVKLSAQHLPGSLTVVGYSLASLAMYLGLDRSVSCMRQRI